MMIRATLAVYHRLPSPRGEGLILSGELTQHPVTAGEEGTRPVSDRKRYRTQESEAFNELRKAGRGEVPPSTRNGTNVSSTLVLSSRP